MTYLGDFALGKTFDVKFCTVNTSGVPTQLAGTPAVSAYPDNSTTQITAGITLTVDFDSVTGLNNVRVVATSGNGYATATNYALVITTGTVSGSSVVGYVIAHFSIENRSALRPTTADRTLDVDASGGCEVGSFQTGAIGAAAFAAGAIDSAAIAANAIGASEIADGAIDAATFAAGAIDATAIANGAIDAATFAAGAIDASAIAADAIGSSELAATAVAEIADAVWDEAVSGHTTQGTYGERQNAVISGNAIAGTLSTTAMTTDLTEATDDHYNGRTLIWTSGVLTGQATNITDYTGATKLLTYTAVTEAPSAGDDFLIV